MKTINSIGSAKQIVYEVGKVIVGKDEIIIKMLLAILGRGHILMEDIPGVVKSTMALAFSRALGLDYNRVQFTPDVLPSDITGFSIYDKNTGKMSYQRGAILCNLFLADELNRATSRTQAALLQDKGDLLVDGGLGGIAILGVVLLGSIGGVSGIGRLVCVGGVIFTAASTQQQQKGYQQQGNNPFLFHVVSSFYLLLVMV